MSGDAQADIEAELAAAKANGHDTGQRTIEILRLADMRRPNLETKGLVKGLIDHGVLAVIYGEPGSGKTFLALDMALHVAAGIYWFGHRVRRPGRVIYVAAEAGKSISKRVAAWLAEKNVDDDADFRAVVSPVNLSKMSTGDAKLLAQVIGEKVDLVIVDTLARAMGGGDENTSVDMGGFIAVMDQLREWLGCAIVVVHHSGKDQSRGARGWSGLLGAVDVEICVEKRDERVSVAINTKQRDLGLADDIAFVRRQVVLGHDDESDPVTSCVIEVADYVPEKMGHGPTGQAKAALDVLNQTVAEKGTTVPFGDLAICAVKVDDWREAMERSALFGEGAKFRTAWMRARGKLGDDGHVAFGEGYVWPTAVTGDLLI